MIFPACRRHGEASSRRQVYQRDEGNDNRSIAVQQMPNAIFRPFGKACADQGWREMNWMVPTPPDRSGGVNP
jgi:hypothetical protein